MSPKIDRGSGSSRDSGLKALPQPVPDDTIIAAFERIEAVRDGIPLTYFEYGTLAAAVVFSDARLDAWILEVGMGGRLDATNTIEPTAALITNVALDHCDWLGEDVETIAMEKAGVMRAGIPAVYGGLEPPRAILRQAQDIGARLLLRGRDFEAGPGRRLPGRQRGCRHRLARCGGSRGGDRERTRRVRIAGRQNTWPRAESRD